MSICALKAKTFLLYFSNIVQILLRRGQMCTFDDIAADKLQTTVHLVQLAQIWNTKTRTVRENTWTTRLLLVQLGDYVRGVNSDES